MNGITKCAVVLLVLGAALLTGPVFGFSTIASDRALDATVENDTAAYLGIFDNSDSPDADVASDSDGEVFYLDDNTGSFDASSIEADVIQFDGQTTNLVAQVDEINTERDFVVSVACGTADTQNTGTLTVQLNATGNPNIDLTRETTQSVTVECQGRSGSFFEVVNASTGERNSTAVITLENVGDKQNIKHISIDSTSSGADNINNGRDPEISFSNTDINERNGAIAIDGSQHRLNQKVNSGETVTVTMREFRDGTDPVDIYGETIELTLYENKNEQTIRVSIPES